MDARARIERPPPEVALSVSFNSLCSHFGVGTSTGWRILTTADCTVELTEKRVGGAAHVQMLKRNNIIAIVGTGIQGGLNGFKVQLWNADEGTREGEIVCAKQVRGVRMLEDRVIVILRDEVLVHDTRKTNPKLLTSFPTWDNPGGICCECGPKMIAFPGRGRGQVQLVELGNFNTKFIPAHSSPLRAVASNRDGERLATASESGTLIRVWSTFTNAKVAELRRGADSATIFSLALNPSGTLLASTSDRGTLHVFDLPKPPAPPPPSSPPLGPAAAFDKPSNKSSNEDVAPESESPVASEDSRSLVEAVQLEAEQEEVVERDAAPDVRKVVKTPRWGLLSRVPFLPNYFRDHVSFATTSFSMSEEPWNAGTVAFWAGKVDVERFPKGIIGWTAEDRLVVIGCGCSARFENFHVTNDNTGEGKRIIIRDSWKDVLYSD